MNHKHNGHIRLISLPFKCLIYLYKGLISPFLGPRCRFYPSCSQYALEALETYNLLTALWLIAKRLLRCHPYGSGGIDPVIKQKEKNRV